MNVVLKKYSELSVDELYDLLTLRQEVFIVEQDCPYLDTDGKDQSAYHLMIYNEDHILMAYTRLVDKGVSYTDYASIGRVVTRISHRGKGLGKELMKQSIKHLARLYHNPTIKISAQAHLSNFYQELGFEPTGEAYLEDNIPHIGMILETK